MGTTAPATDVIRVATRAYTRPHGSMTGTRTYLHINCDCKIKSTLMGTYHNLDDARRKAAELVEGTGVVYKECSKSGPVKAEAAARPVWRFENTHRASISTINGTGVRDGDVVVIEPERVVAVVIRTAVIAITAERGHLLDLSTPIRTFRKGQYAEAADRAEAEARKIGATIGPLHADPAAEETPAEGVTPADVVRTDGVKVEADGRGKWIVVRGGDLLGAIFDDGQMKRGRFAGWSPYVGTRHNTTAFSDDPAEVVESIVQAWPVTAAELVAKTGASLDDVLATAAAVNEEWQADGRRAVLRIAAAKAAGTKMTRAAAAAVAARLAAPVPPLVLDLAPGHCVHGEYAAGVKGDPAAVCARKGSAASVGVFSDEGCVDAFDCAVQAASAAYVMNAEDEAAREADPDDEPLYTWAVLCGQHEEQRADSCEECAAEDAEDTPADEDGAEEEALAELPGPEWGTLKGFAAPFRLWGEEREGGRFAPAFDRKQVTGEPLVIVEVWTTQRGTARHGQDAGGREIHLYGGATRFWRAPGA
ncbi:hypothetical protein ACFV27_00770 [Streptomyces antimycoticus]|uniref:hypothetical protein n=1 Tax=Streptomyces antimycoticus TaxID=68175 RepID=UPI003690441B